MHTAQAIRDRDEALQRALHGLDRDDDAHRHDDYTGAPLREDQR